MNAEWLTSNARISYPFQEDAVGLDRDDVLRKGTGDDLSLLPVSFLVDASIQVPRHRQLYLGRLAIYQPSEDHGVLTCRMDLTTTGEVQALRVMFRFTELDTADRYLVARGTDYASIIPPSTNDETEATYARLLVNVETARRVVAELQNGSVLHFGDTLPLSDHVVDVRAGSVHSLTPCRFAAFSNENPAPHLWSVDDTPQGGVRGDGMLMAGYNVGINSTVDQAGNESVIEITASPGAGMGQLPCAGTGEAVRPISLMGLTPVNGNVNLAGDNGCYDVTPLKYDGNWKLQVSGNCDACCTCDDYAAVVAALRKLGIRTNALAELLKDAGTQYTDGVTRFNAAGGIAPHMNDWDNSNPDIFELQLSGAKGPDFRYLNGAMVAGSENVLRVVAMVRNRLIYDKIQISAMSAIVTSPRSLTARITNARWELARKGGALNTLAEAVAKVPEINPLDTLKMSFDVMVPLKIWRATPEWNIEVSVAANGTQRQKTLVVR